MLDVMGNYSAEICRVEFNVKENFKSYRELYAGSFAFAGKKTVWSFA
jgi:hypothetical protein